MPLFLREHGYEIEEIELAVRAGDTPTLSRALRQILDTSKRKTHLIVSPIYTQAALDLAFEGHERLATLTVLTETKTKGKKSLRPYRLPVFERPDLLPSPTASNFKIETQALHHLVSLAELDLQ